MPKFAARKKRLDETLILDEVEQAYNYYKEQLEKLLE